MALMTWNNNFSVGVNSIDAQHMTLFKIVNELHDAMIKGEAQKVTGELLKKLVVYTQSHFSFEEGMMASAKYPALAEHHVHHEDLVRQVSDFMERFGRGDSSINVELLQFLSGWLTRHIKQEDKGYGPWLNQHGVH